MNGKYHCMPSIIRVKFTMKLKVINMLAALGHVIHEQLSLKHYFVLKIVWFVETYNQICKRIQQEILQDPENV